MSELALWTAPDKRDHAAVGVAIGAISESLVLRMNPHAPVAVQFVLGLLPAAIAGALKEVYDHDHRDHHTPEFRDAAATAAGGALGALSIDLVWKF